MKAASHTIPDLLIYEMIDGMPIYYKGYKEYLNGNKPIEELMASSYLQGALSAQLVILLSQLLDMDQFRIISNEIGLKFGKRSWRAADLAVFKKSVLKQVALSNKYLEVAPELVVEIDTKADLEEIKNPLGYYQEKTDQLLAFGVKKVVWIFTETEKVLVAEQNRPWQITHWNYEVELAKGAVVNIAAVVAELGE